MTKEQLIQGIVTKLRKLDGDALEDIDADVDSHVREMEGED